MRVRQVLASLLMGGAVAWGLTLAPLSSPRAILSLPPGLGPELYFSPNGQHLVLVTVDRQANPEQNVEPSGSAQLWDVANARCVAALTDRDPYVFSVAFAPDGSACVGGLANGTVRVWDIKTGAVIREVSSKLLKLSDRHAQVAWAPDNRLLFQSPFPPAIAYMHDVETDRQVHATPPVQGCSMILTRFQGFIVGVRPGRLIVARRATGEQTAAFDVADFDPDRETVLALSPDGGCVLVGDAMGLRLFTGAGSTRLTVPHLEMSNLIAWQVFFGGGRSGQFGGQLGSRFFLSRTIPYGPAISNDGKLLAYCERAYRRKWILFGQGRLTDHLRVIDARTCREVAVFPNVNRATFSPDGRLAIITDGAVQLWDVPPRRPWIWISVASLAATALTYGFLSRWPRRRSRIPDVGTQSASG